MTRHRIEWVWCSECEPSRGAPVEVTSGQAYMSRTGCLRPGHAEHTVLVPGDLQAVMTAVLDLGGWSAVELFGWEWWRGRSG